MHAIGSSLVKIPELAATSTNHGTFKVHPASCIATRLASLALATVLGGCITYERSGGDWGLAERVERSIAEIISRSTDVETEIVLKSHAEISPQLRVYLNRHFKIADELVLARQKNIEYSERQRLIFDITLKLPASLEIIESQKVATAFPNGKVLVGRTFVQGFTPQSTDLDPLLLGIFVHELTHIRDGHAIDQWATADNRQAWFTNSVLSGLAKLTTLTGLASVKYEHTFPFTYSGANQLPVLSEYAADLAVISILDMEDYNTERYVEHITQSAQFTEPSLTPVQSIQAKQRAKCLKLNFATEFDQGLKAVHAGSHKAGDNVVAIWDFKSAHTVVSMLRDPRAAELSTKDRKNFLGFARRSLFIECAVISSFPDVKPIDGVLEVLAFDLFMFSKYVRWPE